MISLVIILWTLGIVATTLHWADANGFWVHDEMKWEYFSIFDVLAIGLWPITVILILIVELMPNAE